MKKKITVFLKEKEKENIFFYDPHKISLEDLASPVTKA